MWWEVFVKEIKLKFVQNIWLILQTLLSIQLWNDSFQKGIESYHTAVNYKDLLRSSCLDPYQRIAWAAQEKMFIILNARLAETHGIRAVKPVSKSMFTKITKLDSQTG